jgi:hypothetical protein
MGGGKLEMEQQGAVVRLLANGTFSFSQAVAFGKG